MSKIEYIAIILGSISSLLTIITLLVFWLCPFSMFMAKIILNKKKNKIINLKLKLEFPIKFYWCIFKDHIWSSIEDFHVNSEFKNYDLIKKIEEVDNKLKNIDAEIEKLESLSAGEYFKLFKFYKASFSSLYFKTNIDSKEIMKKVISKYKIYYEEFISIDKQALKAMSIFLGLSEGAIYKNGNSNYYISGSIKDSYIGNEDAPFWPLILQENCENKQIGLFLYNFKNNEWTFSLNQKYTLPKFIYDEINKLIKIINEVNNFKNCIILADSEINKWSKYIEEYKVKYIKKYKIFNHYFWLIDIKNELIGKFINHEFKKHYRNLIECLEQHKNKIYFRKQKFLQIPNNNKIVIHNKIIPFRNKKHFKLVLKYCKDLYKIKLGK